VALSARKWPGKRRWLEARRKEGKWKEVRAFDAGDLETWIESTPAEALRIGPLVGKPGVGAGTLDDWWHGWRCATDPALTEAVVLAGRDDAAGAIAAWLRDEQAPPTAAVWAGTADEAMAAVAATIHCLEPRFRDSWATRAIIVDNPYAWKQLVGSTATLLLLPTFRVDEEIGSALRRSHRVVTVHGNAIRRLDNRGILLPRLERGALGSALEALGLPKERCDELALTGRGSFQALRRQLGIRPESLVPSWSDSPAGSAVVLAMLVGYWDGSSIRDQKLLAAIVGTAYEVVERALTDASGFDDPPVLRVGSNWYFAARRDTWRILAHRLTSLDLKRFSEVALTSLERPDPAWSLSNEERWKATLRGSDALLSGDARRGLVEGLALLALEEVTPEHRRIALNVIHGLLQACRRDWTLWPTIGSGIADLAELAPEAFLATVEASLGDTVPAVLRLFGGDRGDSDPFLDRPQHVHLLWALERLAWSQQYLTRAVKILGTLARQDPGGRYLNRPAASLGAIFCPWLPQTSGSLEERVQALDALQDAEPETTFQLLLGLLPNRAGVETLMPSGAPRWRDWRPEERHVTGPEYVEAISDISRRLVELARSESRRWQPIAERIDRVPSRDRLKVASALREAGPTLGVACRDGIWEKLRDLTSSHRRFMSAKWALPDSELRLLEELQADIQPEDLVIRVAWLFGHSPHLLEDDDAGPFSSKLDERRQATIKAVLAEEGLSGVHRLARAVEVPGFVGRALGQLAVTDDIDDEVLQGPVTDPAGAPDSTADLLVRGFIGGRIEAHGPAWRDRVVQRYRERLPADRVATFFLMGSPGPELWDRLGSESLEVQRAYWGGFPVLGLGQNPPVRRLLDELLRNDQPVRAVALASLYARALLDSDLPSAVLALDRVISADPNALVSLRYDVLRLLSRLQSSEALRAHVVKLEWMLLGLILEAPQYSPLLYEEMATTPELFVQLCDWAFAGEKPPSQQFTEQERNRALHAYRLLKAWRGLPGVGKGQAITFDSMMKWISEARAALAQSGRAVVGHLQIGEAIGLPLGPNGERPHPEIRRLIEALGNPDVERGIEMRVFNSRGIYSPSAGREEWQLARQYRRESEGSASVWPRTAALLGRIADTFEDWARREELEHAKGQQEP
jgi:hypothetical protein